MKRDTRNRSPTARGHCRGPPTAVQDGAASHRPYLLYNRRIFPALDRAAGVVAHVTLLRRCGPDLLFLVEENQ